MKACRIDGGRAPLILNHSTGMAVSGRLHSPAVSPPGRNLDISWKEGWAGCKAGLGYLEKRNISGLGRNSNSVPSNP